MSLREKLERLDSPMGPPKESAQSFIQVRAADGPNGIARGPFPGPPPPMATGVTAFPNEIAVAATWDRDLAAGFGRPWQRSGEAKVCLKSSGPR
jgi:beta-glucosidase-like glycosyl hydrolase